MRLTCTTLTAYLSLLYLTNLCGTFVRGEGGGGDQGSTKKSCKTNNVVNVDHLNITVCAFLLDSIDENPTTYNH